MTTTQIIYTHINRTINQKAKNAAKRNASANNEWNENSTHTQLHTVFVAQLQNLIEFKFKCMDRARNEYC